MATSAAAGKAVAKDLSNEDWAEATLETFTAGQYVEKTVILTADAIQIDGDLTHGQVRPVLEETVHDLIQRYGVMEPDELILTVVQDKGRPPVHLPWLHVFACMCLAWSGSLYRLSDSKSFVSANTFCFLLSLVLNSHMRMVFTDTCLRCCLPAGTGNHFVLHGQHEFTASQAIKHRLETAGSMVPGWCKQFRCKIVREDVDLATLQRIALEDQAMTANVVTVSFTRTMRLYKKEMDAIVNEYKRRGEHPVLNRRELLRTTYNKTGKNANADGPVVCAMSLRWLSLSSALAAFRFGFRIGMNGFGFTLRSGMCLLLLSCCASTCPCASCSVVVCPTGRLGEQRHDGLGVRVSVWGAGAGHHAGDGVR